MLAHLRTEAYPVYRAPGYDPAGASLSYEQNLESIARAKSRLASAASNDPERAGHIADRTAVDADDRACDVGARRQQ